ncbi:histidinol-phosphate transaminase [Alcaligenaceae bacterium C4P045]|nr:histidinol-phosphate transaminase [Alcaligenaceae bacterium C4P045]
MTAARATQVAATIRADIQAMTAYPVGHSLDAIKLDAMECPYPLPDHVRDEIAQAARDAALNRYPGGDLTALHARLRAAFGIPEAASVMCGNGSDELIHLIVQACCEPGDVVLSPAPSFVYFEMAARFDHARYVGVPLKADLTLDLAATLDAIATHRPKVVFLAMPNNPTGGSWAPTDVAAIIAAAPGLVVIDEAYQPFTDHTWMPQVLDFDNVVVMRTVSKIGLAGLRFGYVAGDAAWIGAFDKIRPPYNIGVLTQAVLHVVLKHKAVLDAQAAQMRADRAPLAEALAALPGTTVYPSAGNFLLVRFSGTLDGNTIHRSLKERRILVRNFGHSHPLLADCLRISIGTPDENAALLAALKDLLKA